ncbi:hypothetical protein GIB67_024807 [Kingdonia uniflora]|uniref:Uncharacterized protein n=1 Tax=Kingdonia uniflora TaxID=39325 RepID=A0A7J7NYC2_9MAGN|nr:hypothetical protein GIB67_024807 [Kingdonia uniflora]
MKLYVTRDVGMRLKPPVESGSSTSVLVTYVHDYEDCVVTVKLVFHLGLDGTTESQEGICVSFGCHILRLFQVLVAVVVIFGELSWRLNLLLLQLGLLRRGL